MMISWNEVSAESKLADIAFTEGSLYFCADTGNMYLDSQTQGKRIGISLDIIYIDTESERESILAPIPNKIYFIKNSKKLYIYDGSWSCLNEGCQSDWKQDDSTKPDFIKNRTHYDISSSLVLNMQTIETEYDENEGIYINNNIPLLPNINIVDQFEIIFNYAFYEYPAIEVFHFEEENDDGTISSGFEFGNLETDGFKIRIYNDESDGSLKYATLKSHTSNPTIMIDMRYVQRLSERFLPYSIIAKLNTIPTVDTELSDISENPVQNKVVKEAFDNIEKIVAVDENHDGNVIFQSFVPGETPAPGAIDVDKTLSIEGMAADAKAVGDALDSIPVIDDTLTIAGAAADAKAVGDWMNNVVLSENNYGASFPDSGEEGLIYFIEDAGCSPYNHLDNSDFTNPINQRGQIDYNSAGYTIDRWKIDVGYITLSVESGHVKITPTASGYNISQPVGGNAALLAGKTVTFALNYGGNLKIVLACIGESRNYFYETTNENGLAVGTCTVPIDTQAINFVIQTNDTNGSEIYWAALYEGRYTVDTLPEYKPKGYGAELVECQRYYQKLGSNFVPLLNNTNTIGSYIYRLSVNYPVAMRIIPTITLGEPADSSYKKPSAIAYINNCLLHYNSSTTNDIVQCKSIELNADL